MLLYLFIIKTPYVLEGIKKFYILSLSFDIKIGYKTYFLLIYGKLFVTFLNYYIILILKYDKLNIYIIKECIRWKAKLEEYLL
jgi:hypothetical protein